MTTCFTTQVDHKPYRDLGFAAPLWLWHSTRHGNTTVFEHDDVLANHSLLPQSLVALHAHLLINSRDLTL